MNNQTNSFLSEDELKKAILEEKTRGTPDIIIGQKYGVTYRYIEQVITKSQGINVSVLKNDKKIKMLQPRDFKEEQTTVWSFKHRGNWATHSGEYRGNWSPYIPRNIILKYSKPGELVLDYFCGAGTTAVEAKLLGRRCIALDINDKAIELARKNVEFSMESNQLKLLKDEKVLKVYEPELMVGDARDLSFLENNSVDLICAHPPYANIINYTDHREGDLSFLDIHEYLKEMFKVAQESFRVLKPGRQCAILIGDMRRKKHVIPLGFKLIDVYLKAGFKLRELVIKRQHNCKTTGFWYANSIKYNFLLLAHEYLPIFEKPTLSHSFEVEEKQQEYVNLTQMSERLFSMKKLAELETTTVWIFPEDDFEERLNKNVVERYWRGDGYLIITLSPSLVKKEDDKIQKKKSKISLLFIKADPDCMRGVPGIESFLKEVKNIIEKNLNNLNKGGAVVIFCRDTRINGYIEPVAKRMVNSIKYDELMLKEIIVVTSDGVNSKEKIQEDYLRIIHQYLLVFEMK